MPTPTNPGAQPPAPSPDELASPIGQLLERSAAAMALADLDARITYANPAFLQLWGYADARAVAGRDGTREFWLEPAAARAAVDVLLSSGVWQGELSALTARGAVVPVRVTAQLLHDARQQPVSILATFVDISAERAARAAWQAERDFTELVFGTAGVLLLALDEEGRFIRFNVECERVSGWRADEVLGRFPWETVLPPGAAPTIRDEAFDAAMRSAALGHVTRYTNEWQARSGARRPIDWTNRVVLDPTRQRRIMVSVGVDVTARRETERSLIRSEAQLRAAQAVARMGSWTLDIASQRLEWSDEVYRLFEVDRHRFGGSFESFLAVVHPDDRALVEQAYAQSLRNRQPYRLQHRIRTPDGRIKWVEERCETDFGADGVALRSRGTVQDITESHEREVELLRFRHMVEHAPEEVWLTDDAFRVVYANAAACDGLGFAREDLVGRHLADIDAGGVASLRSIVEAVDGHRVSGQRPQVFRVHHRAADGRLVPKEIYATVRDIDGRRHGISFARDISEQLRTQQALAASESLLRATLDAYPGWVACVDADMRYVYVNAQFAQVVGLPTDAIVGRTADDVLGGQGREERWALHRRLLDGEGSISAERRFVDRCGRERIAWVEYRRQATVAQDAQPRFFAFAADVTELRLAQQRLATVTQDIGIGLWELNLPAGSVDFNDELLALAGFARTDVVGDERSWLAERIDPADRPGRARVIQDLASDRVPRAQVQIRVQHKDGHAVWVQEALRVVSRNDHGQPLRLIGVAQDISALKAREAELEALTQALESRVAQRTQALEAARHAAERANAAKSEFLSQMSHELRTPLNAIIGFGQLLEMSNLSGEDAGHVREVMRAGWHLLRLIDEILDLASVEAGRLRLRQEAVALQPLVEDCMRLLGPTASATGGVSLQAGEIAPAAAVVADPGRLKQVLLNLLSNAIKYNRRDGRVRVSVDACADEPERWELRVTDTGHGLTAEQIDRLFQPFERLGADRSGIQGTGIGLALSRRLMELMGGTLGVTSRSGHGSEFWLRLPRAASGPVGDASRGAPGGGAVHPPPGTATPRRHRILYVEDNEANQRLLEHLLARRADIELRTVPTARESLALVDDYRPALLLIDIQLPDGDGHTLLRDLRARGVRTPAVAVSANAMADDLARGRAAGFDEYLTKPLDLARVLEVLDGMLIGR